MMRFAILVALPWMALAQWPNQKVVGAPRTPDGKVQMDAPTPKTADGHPDFSGVWDRGAPGGAFLRLPSVVQGGLRQFFLDGRKLPKAEDVQPWRFGYSVGRWEGDALIVETVGMRDDGWLDEGSGSPGTNALKLTERFTRPVYGRLEIEMTIDDPKAYTKPFGFKVTQALMPDAELIEFVCAENEQSVKHFK